jgi:DNA-binding CsgD family transcriptional regulator
MASSHRLKLHDLRAAYRLVGEVRELGAQPPAWRRHLLEGLNRVVGAHVGLASEMPASFDGRMPQPGDVLDLGWACDAERNIWLDYNKIMCLDSSAWLGDPAAPGINRLQAANRSFTRLRQHFVDDAQWYRSRYVDDVRRSARVDGFIVSSRVVPHLGVSNLLVLHRAWGEPPPEEPQRRLVALVHAELGRLWDAVPLCDPTANLTPRLRQTLERLRAGDSEKQVAARLGLSRHTVHNYVKDLHRHFEATSRGELLARSAPRFADFRPRLSRELV